MTELEFAKKIHELNGTAYLVGGEIHVKFRGVLIRPKPLAIPIR